MRWTWDYLGETRVLHDDGHDVFMPGAGCVQIRVFREQDTGMPPNVNELEDKIQQSSGRVWLFNYLDVRTVRLGLSLFAKHALEIGAEDIVRAKRLLCQWFNPQPTAPDGTLTFYDNNGIVRAIKARYDRGLEYDWLYTDQGIFEPTLRLICPDPLWYDPELQSVTWAQLGIFDLTLCYELPYVLCEGRSANQAVTNAGDWATYPIIKITGPASDVSIFNISTGEEIRATYSIGAGVTVTYDLTPGVKTVTDNLGNNLMSTLLQPNDLASFHLASAYEYNDSGVLVAPGGVNQIVVSASGATASATMTWYNRYLSN